jgi:hypothetical protein
MLLITLVWNGVPIPNCDPPSGTEAAIYALGLPDLDAEHLWALWCSLDASVEDNRDAALLAELNGDEIAEIVIEPMNSCMSPDESKEMNEYNGYDWSALPGWCRANSDKISTRIT